MESRSFACSALERDRYCWDLNALVDEFGESFGIDEASAPLFIVGCRGFGCYCFVNCFALLF